MNITDQMRKRFDPKALNHQMLSDSDSRMVKRTFNLPANATKIISFDMGFDFSTLLIHQVGGNTASSEVDLKIYTWINNFYDPTAQSIQLWELEQISFLDQESGFRMNPLILPIFSFGKEITIEMSEQLGQNLEFNLYLFENKYLPINETNCLQIRFNQTITAAGNHTENIKVPYKARFFSVGFEVTDASNVSKDYLVNARTHDTRVPTLESDMIQTENYSFFDLIPINPLFEEIQLRINNDGGSSIVWDFAWITFYF